MADPKNLAELIDSLEPSVRKAFRDSIANIKSDVQMAILIRAIENGDIPAALTAIGLDESYFRPLDDALRAAHLAGGDFTIEQAKRTARRQGATVTGAFNARNQRAEAILRFHSSGRVVAITETTREGLRVALRDALERGAAPRTVALDLVGRVSPSGVRQGGIVGLDPSKAQLVNDMRNALSPRNGIGYIENAQGQLVKKFWIGADGNLQSTYSIRDRRFDSAIKRAIQNGQPIPQTQIRKMTDRYTGRLQRLRGEAIARTEIQASVMAAQDEGVQQVIDSGQIESENVAGVWDASRDMFTRDDHRAANGQRRSHGEPFDVGGYMMMRPLDGSLGAPAAQIVNCRCIKRIDMDFMAGLKNRLSEADLALARALL